MCRLANYNDNHLEWQADHQRLIRTEEQPKQGSEAPRRAVRKDEGAPQFTPLNIAYDRLLPLIRDLPDFKWPPPMRVGPDQCNRSLRCDYHREHGHETNHCQSLIFLVEKMIQAGHLRRYIREPTRGVAAASTANRVVVDIEHALGPRPAINIILGGPTDS